MRARPRRLVAGVAIVTALFGLYAAHLVRSLDTPEFKARVAQEASAVLGSRVLLGSVNISLLRGVRLAGVRVQNPPGFRGDLLSVEEARLSYELWPLLLGRVQVDELRLRKPVVTLASDSRGSFNYRKLSGLGPTPAKGTSAPTPASSLLKLVISKLSVDGARFAVMDAGGHSVLRLDGASLDSTVSVEAGVLTGNGKSSVDAVILANALFLKGVRAPVKITKERMSLGPLQAKLAEGAVTGDLGVDFKPEMRYGLQLSVSGASLATLIKEAGSTATLTGTLEARAKVEGTGDVTSMNGGGQAQVRDCRWPKPALFGALASILQIPELAEPRFDDCRVEFTLGGGQARTPVVSFKGPALELTGRGAMNLATSALDYDLTLALSPGLVAKAPGTIRSGFKTRPDGFGAIDFKVTGTTAAPKNDLAARFGRTLAIETAKERLLGRLFGKKKPQ